MEKEEAIEILTSAGARARAGMLSPGGIIEAIYTLLCVTTPEEREAAKVFWNTNSGLLYIGPAELERLCRILHAQGSEP